MMEMMMRSRNDKVILAAHFRAKGRVHVPGLLAAEQAFTLREALLASNHWRLVFNRGEQLYELDRATLGGMSAEQRQTLLDAIHREGRNSFQYVYESIRVPELVSASSGELELDEFALFLNSVSFLEFARRLVGDDDINYVDCQATRFGAGHFLNEHDDAVAGKDRVAAYVFNLTAPWQAHWGGQLQFIGSDGHVDEAFVPTFNALNLLRVPQRHLVSAVAPLADPEVGRLSVTGWLRRRPPALA